MARALGIHVHERVQKAAASGQSRSQGDVAGLGGARGCTHQLKLLRGTAGTNYAEVLAAAYPSAAETVQEVWPKLPVEPADDGIAAELLTTRCTRLVAKVHLKPGLDRAQGAGIG